MERSQGRDVAIIYSSTHRILTDFTVFSLNDLHLPVFHPEILERGDKIDFNICAGWWKYTTHCMHDNVQSMDL